MLFASDVSDDASYEEEEGAELSDEEIVDGVMKMKISEIRAELDMRGVDNTGITSKVRDLACEPFPTGQIDAATSSWFDTTRSVP